MTDEFGIPKGPNADFWFGADRAGRDLFVRVLYGARTSLIVAFSRRVSMADRRHGRHGAGYCRGFLDTVISRLGDIMLALPQLLHRDRHRRLVRHRRRRAASAGSSSPGSDRDLRDLGSSPGLHRPDRARRPRCRSARRSSSRRAARWARATSHHVPRDPAQPRSAPIIVYTTLLIPSSILFEAALSFLGLGVPLTRPPGAGAARTGRHRTLRRRLVADVVPGPVPRYHDACVQPARRRPARCARPEGRPLR